MLLPNILGMKLFVFLNDFTCAGCRHFGIVRSVLRNLEAGLVSHVVLEHIEDKTFLNCLVHPPVKMIVRKKKKARRQL